MFPALAPATLQKYFFNSHVQVGDTALSMASLKGHEDIVRLLLQSGVRDRPNKVRISIFCVYRWTDCKSRAEEHEATDHQHSHTSSDVEETKGFEGLQKKCQKPTEIINIIIDSTFLNSA